MLDRFEEFRLSPLIEAALAGDPPKGGGMETLLQRWIDVAVEQEVSGGRLVEACGYLIAELGRTLSRVGGNEDSERKLREGAAEGAERLLKYLAVHVPHPESLMWLGLALLTIGSGRAEEP